MKKEIIYNFAAGPAMLPKEVLTQVQSDIQQYKLSQTSILELGHRTIQFEDILKHAKLQLKTLLQIPDTYEILFTQGGASLQFAMIPMNLIHNKQADYVLTGLFSELAYDEAKRYGNIHIAGSTKHMQYCRIPTQDMLCISKDSSYVYVCWNNTVYGSMWHYVPDTNHIPLVADMTSCLLTQQIDVEKFGLIFAGTQKNLGIAGLCVIIIRKDLITFPISNIPTLLRYDVLSRANSMYQTPPIFAIYVMDKVLEWMKQQGGIQVLEKQNKEKSSLLYRYLDQSMFYQTKIHVLDRSIVNVTFYTPNEQLDKQFIEEAKQNGLYNVQGHKKVKGIRISLYNAMPLEGVKALVVFMRIFEERYKSFV